jgi:hypothetical protein
MAYANDYMLIITSPEDFPSWPEAQKMRRYEKVVQWHDHVLNLNKSGKMPWVWGSYQLLSAYEPTGNQGTLVAVYRADSLADFSEVMLRDPLRDCSKYTTLALASVTADYDEDMDDLARQAQAGVTGHAAGLAREVLQSLQRAAPPYYDAKARQVAEAPNIAVDVNQDDAQSDYVDYLLYGTATNGSADWLDARRALYTEKVKWWHAYNADLIRKGYVTHAWSTHTFCHSGSQASTKKGACLVMRARSLSEMDQVYGANPLLEEALFISVALRPIGAQRRSDQAKLQLAKAATGSAPTP